MDSIKNLFSTPQNFAGLPEQYSRLDTSKVVILPVPYDGTAEWHSGTRDAPQAIINASRYMEMYDMELDREICTTGIHTLPPLEPVLSGPEEMVQTVYLAARHIIQQGKFPVMLGGEHTLTIGMAQAAKERYNNLSVLQFDAHADLRNEYLGTKYNHGCPMRRIMEFCPVTQVGIRTLGIEEQQFIKEHNLYPFYMDRLLDPDATSQIISSLNRDIYITIDCDAFDPSIMPAVGMPEPGGMTWQQVLSILRAITKERNVVGFDVVELFPHEGPDACSFLAAKLIYKLIGYCVS